MKTGSMTKLTGWILGLSMFSLMTMGAVQTAAADLVPPALTGTAYPAYGYVMLKWTDPNTNESGYVVERSLTGTSGFVALGYTGPNAKSLTDPNVTAGTTYYYQIRAYTSGGGVTSAPSNMLAVPYGSGTTTAPSITSQPSNATVTAPASATFSVSASGTALNYQWSKNGVRITGATGATYTTPPTSMADSETRYRVVVYNGMGNVMSSTATLTVNAGAVMPSITSQPSNATVTAPASATFTVSATGTSLSYQWKKNGVIVGSGPSYTTPATSTADSGSTFLVVVSNTAGSVISSTATLTVNAGAVMPSITSQPSNATVTAPASATFSVSASGTAPLSYQWQKHGVNIAGATGAGYTTPATSTADSGSNYRVIVSNSMGSATSSTAMLTVNQGADLTPPSIPTGVSASASSCSQISVSWGASADNTGGSGMKAYNLYRNGAYLKQILAPSTSTTDSGLSPSGVYSYAVSAIDNAGNQSVQSATASTNTPPCNLPPVANAGSDQTGNAGSAVSLNGSSSYDPDGAITSYTWNFGDGASGSGISVTHSYANAGTYTVMLTVTDNAGSTSSDSAVVTVQGSGPAAGAAVWARQLGGLSRIDAVFGYAVATDVSGNIITTGVFKGSADFGLSRLTSAVGSEDIFLAKFSPSGEPLWSKGFGNEGFDGGNGVVTDAAGNIILVGYFERPLDLGGQTLTGKGWIDIFVAKFSPNGTLLWAKSFGNTGSDAAYGVTLDAQGNIFVTGYFSGTVDFGGGPLTSAGLTDIFLAKFSPGGAYLWARRFGGAGNDVARAVAVDLSGDIAMTGFFQGSADFGNGPVTAINATDSDLFIGKYSGADGHHHWSKAVGGVGSDSGNSLAFDASGNLVVTGSFRGTINFGGGALVNAGGADIFLVKYAGSTGAHIWSKRFGNAVPLSSGGAGVVIDASSNIILTGAFIAGIDFGGGYLISKDVDVFFAKYAPDGAHLWSKRFGEPGEDRGVAVAFAPTGHLLLLGTLRTGIDLGTGLIQSHGDYDAFLVKFAP